MRSDLLSTIIVSWLDDLVRLQNRYDLKSGNRNDLFLPLGRL